MTTTRSGLRAELSLHAIKRDLVALLGKLDDAALIVPGAQRAHVEALADELRWPLRTILEPLCEGRAPTLVPSPKVSLDSEEALDSDPRVRRPHQPGEAA